MLAIGALTSSIGLLSYVKYKTLLLSSKMHRAGSLSALAFGLAGVSGNQTAIAATAAATTGINGILATNYAGGFLSMREQTVDDIGNEIGEKKQRKKIKGMQGSKWLLSKLTSKTVSNESVFV
jgi:hypothetical protein